MNTKKLIVSLQSILFLPMTALPIHASFLSSLSQIPAPLIISDIREDNIPFLKQKAPVRDIFAERANAIDEYYAKYNLPLEGYGRKMVEEANNYNLDWRILPAIAMQESTGGKFACGYNPFGWNSCKTSFQSFDQAIEIVAMNLGGANPRTAHYYDGELTETLTTYNGDAVPNYARQVVKIMNTIAPEA